MLPKDCFDLPTEETTLYEWLPPTRIVRMDGGHGVLLTGANAPIMEIHFKYIHPPNFGVKRHFLFPV
jgi:hypothetical protein